MDGDYPDALTKKLRANYRDFAQFTRRDVESLARLRGKTELPLLAKVPMLEKPPTSVDGLETFASLLVRQLR